MLRTIPLAMLLLGVALATAGCDARSSTTAAQEQGQVLVLRNVPAGGALLARMKAAPWKVAYEGQRVVTQHWIVDGRHNDLVYREHVVADGTGRFAVLEPELIEPQLPHVERELWVLLQDLRQGFLYRYRDFAIRDERAFARNYTVALIDSTIQIAGRSCDEVLVQRRREGAMDYEIAVDHETGLILRSIERRPDGSVLQQVEFEWVSFTPELSNVAWHEPLYDPAPQSPGPELAPIGSSSPNLPTGDGGAFSLLSIEHVLVNDPDGEGRIVWVEHALTDGVELVFFLDGGVDPQADPEQGLMRVPPSVGPWSVVEGHLHGRRVIGMGRVSTRDLLDSLASCN